MNRNFSLALLVVMASLLIIGFGFTATAEAAGSCTETLLVSVSTSESTVFSNCRAFEADAARYTAIAAYYTTQDAYRRWFPGR